MQYMWTLLRKTQWGMKQQTIETLLQRTRMQGLKHKSCLFQPQEFEDAVTCNEFRPEKLLCVQRFHWFAFIGRDVGHQIYYCQMKLNEWNSVPGTPHRPISINSQYLFYVSQAGCRKRYFRMAVLNMKIYKSENVTDWSQHFQMVHGLATIPSIGVAFKLSFWYPHKMTWVLCKLQINNCLRLSCKISRFLERSS